MKCIVTGAAGFIGSHLCERLIADGHEVIGIDDLSSGSYDNIKSIQEHKHFHFIHLDITNDVLLSPHEIFQGTDWVFHLAAKADVVPSIENPMLYHNTNVTGTVKVLEAAKAFGVKKFIYAASSSCYGIPYNYPTGEESKIRPMYPYALTKSLGEQCVFHWGQVYNLPTISLRLFNVFGPRSRTSGAYGAVFGVFLAQLANGKPLTVVGDGKQARDFTYVTDVVEAFILAAKAPSYLNGNAINIGSGTPHTVNDLVCLLGNPETVSLPDRPGEPRKTHAKTSKADVRLLWKPLVTFEEGVKIMLSLLPQYKNAPLWTRESIGKATQAWFKHLG